MGVCTVGGNTERDLVGYVWGQLTHVLLKRFLQSRAGTEWQEPSACFLPDSDSPLISRQELLPSCQISCTGSVRGLMVQQNCNCGPRCLSAQRGPCLSLPVHKQSAACRSLCCWAQIHAPPPGRAALCGELCPLVLSGSCSRQKTFLLPCPSSWHESCPESNLQFTRTPFKPTVSAPPAQSPREIPATRRTSMDRSPSPGARAFHVLAISRLPSGYGEWVPTKDSLESERKR